MVADPTLKRVGIQSNRKEKVELYFDVAGVMQLVSGEVSDNPLASLTDNIQEQVDSFVKDLLPNTTQIIDFLRSQF